MSWSAAATAADGATTASRPAAAGRRDRGATQRCRVCQKLLTSGADRKLGRCSSCPGSVDEALFEQLRSWRLDRSKELKQPAFCVFTDATLTRIAEVRPRTEPELAAIGGVGPAKLAAYAAEVLAMCSAPESEPPINTVAALSPSALTCFLRARLACAPSTD